MHAATSHTRPLAILLAVIAGAAVLLVAYGPIGQPQEYHRYADARSITGIPHFWNVISNLPFAVIGVAGLWWILRPRWQRLFDDPRDRWMWIVLFSGEVLTCFGSAYYHAVPTNDTLAWDRLAFSLILTAFFSIVVSEFVSARAGRGLLVPMVAAGLASVLYWHWTESRGQGDLRPYMAIQFAPVLLIPLLASVSKGTRIGSTYFIVAWLLYLAAKLCEMNDAAIYRATAFWSGHTVKHLIAAGASAVPLVGLARARKPHVLESSRHSTSRARRSEAAAPGTAVRDVDSGAGGRPAGPTRRW